MEKGNGEGELLEWCGVNGGGALCSWMKKEEERWRLGN